MFDLVAVLQVASNQLDKRIDSLRTALETSPLDQVLYIQGQIAGLYQAKQDIQDIRAKIPNAEEDSFD